jgi:hypothetical protein
MSLSEREYEKLCQLDAEVESARAILNSAKREVREARSFERRAQAHFNKCYRAVCELREKQKSNPSGQARA